MKLVQNHIHLRVFVLVMLNLRLLLSQFLNYVHIQNHIVMLSTWISLSCYNLIY